MKVNLLLCVKPPTFRSKINWLPLIKSINAHQPNLVTLCFLGENFESKFVTYNLSFKLWLAEKGIEMKLVHISDNETSKKEIDKIFKSDYIIRLDVLSGATFAHIDLISRLKNKSEIWATSSDGSKITR
jgi:hypothetical protein